MRLAFFTDSWSECTHLRTVFRAGEDQPFREAHHRARRTPRHGPVRVTDRAEMTKPVTTLTIWRRSILMAPTARSSLQVFSGGGICSYSAQPCKSRNLPSLVAVQRTRLMQFRCDLDDADDRRVFAERRNKGVEFRARGEHLMIVH